MHNNYSNNRQGGGIQHRQQGNNNRPNQGGGYQQEDVEATSPYNFVPLSEKVFFPKWSEQVSHDIPFEKGICGELACELVTDTPVFVRNGGHWKSHDELMKDKNAWESFFCGITADGKKQFMIPGTTLKGTIRSVVEIASFGKFSRVDNHRYSVRDLNNKDKSLYMDWMTRTVDAKAKVYETKISAGWLTAGDDEEGAWTIYPCKMSRVEHNELIQWHGKRPDIKRKQSAPDKYGTWGEKPLNVLFDPGQVTEHANHSCGTLIYSKAENLGKGKMEGIFVFTGQPGPNRRPEQKGSKHFEFIFYGQSGAAITVPDERKQDFIFNHTDANGTENPEWGYWKSKLKKSKIPVFYRLTDDGKKLHSIGLAMMYRLPYRYSIHDAVGFTSREHLDDSRLDLAEAIFGRVADSKSKSSPMEAIKGRVSISAALADLATCRPWTDEPYIQTVLGGPKPTFYPNYIEQPAKIDPFKGQFYNTYMNDNCRLRGWKRYPVRKTETVIRQSVPDGVSNDVDTRMIPLAPKAKFTFKVKLHNMLPAEVGAIIWALTWGGRPHLRHSLGMGKPFGFGQASISLDSSKSSLSDMNGNRITAESVLESYRELMQSFAGKDWEKSREIEQLLAMADPSIAPAQKKLKYPVLTVKPNRNDFAKIKIQGKMLASYVPTGSYLNRIKTSVTIGVQQPESSHKAAIVWPNATLFYNPGTRTISARCDDKQADIKLEGAAAGLVSEEVLNRLKKGKTVIVSVTVESAGGGRFKIMAFT